MEDGRGKVVPFDRKARLQARRKAGDAMARRQQQSREALFAKLEETCTDEKMMDNADRLLVAQNLFRILKRFEQETGQRKAKVVRAANIGSEGDSTKRLEYYRIDPDTSPSPKRVAKLVRHLGNYKRLARKAAELGDREWQDVFIDLFQGSSFLPDSEDSAPHGTHIKTLHSLLDAMGDWLKHTTAIDRYFERLRELPLFDEWGNFIVSDDPALVQSQSQSTGDPWLFLNLTIPSVPLYRELLEERPVDFATNEGLPEELHYVAEPPDMAVVERLQLRSYREVRLGIAPQSWSRPAEMVFEERLVCELWDQDNRRGWLPYWGNWPSREWSEMGYYPQPLPTADVYPDTRAAERSVGPEEFCWMRGAGGKSGGGHRSRKHSLLDDRIAEGAMLPFGLVNQFVHRAGLKNCARYLDVPLDDTIELFLTRFAPGTVYESPPNTVAAALEVDLYIGMSEAEACTENEEDEDQTEFFLRVDLRLRQEIDRRCDLLKRCGAERNALLDRQKQELLSRWELDGDAL